MPVDLQRLFAILARKFGVRITSAADALAYKRREHVRLWASSLSIAEAWACIGASCQLVEKYDQARAAFLQGYRFADDKLTAAWFLNEAANAMYIAGRFSDCARYAKRAISSDRKHADLGLLAGSFNLMGLTRLENIRPDAAGALEHFRIAQMHAERLLRTSRPIRLTEDGLQRFLSRLYNNIGLAYANAGKPRTARKYYIRSLRIKRKRGDLVGLAKTGENLCCLDYAAKQFGSAHYWKKKALEIIDRYDLVFDRAYIFRRLGEISCEQGRKAQGLRYLETALSIYSGNPDLKFGVRLTKDSISKHS